MVAADDIRKEAVVTAIAEFDWDHWGVEDAVDMALADELANDILEALGKVDGGPITPGIVADS